MAEEKILIQNSYLKFIFELSDFKDKNNTEVSDYSHQFMGWQLAELGEDIPYECALVSINDDLTSEEREYGKGLHNLASQVLGG